MIRPFDDFVKVTCSHYCQTWSSDALSTKSVCRTIPSIHVFSVPGHLRPSSPRPCMSPPALQLYLDQDGPIWGEFLIVTLLYGGV